jgi:hypothetical protein
LRGSGVPLVPEMRGRCLPRCLPRRGVGIVAWAGRLRLATVARRLARDRLAPCLGGARLASRPRRCRMVPLKAPRELAIRIRDGHAGRGRRYELLVLRRWIVKLSPPRDRNIDIVISTASMKKQTAARPGTPMSTPSARAPAPRLLPPCAGLEGAAVAVSVATLRMLQRSS